MRLSRQTGHVGSVVMIEALAAVVHGVSGGEGAAGGKRSMNGACWWVCAKGVGGRRWWSGVWSRGTVLVSTR